VEEEQELLEEPTQAEEAANAELTKGKSRCIPLKILVFYFWKLYFIILLIVH
jgi:hypothetical protein